MVRLHALAGALFGLFVLTGCYDSPSVSKSPPDPQPAEGETLSIAVGDDPKAFPGLHNVGRVSEKLLSGSAPELLMVNVRVVWVSGSSVTLSWLGATATQGFCSRRAKFWTAVPPSATVTFCDWAAWPLAVTATA